MHMDRKPKRTGTAISGEGPRQTTGTDGEATEHQEGPPEHAPETGTPMFSLGGHGPEGPATHHGAPTDRPLSRDEHLERGSAEPDRR